MALILYVVWISGKYQENILCLIFKEIISFEETHTANITFWWIQEEIHKFILIPNQDTLMHKEHLIVVACNIFMMWWHLLIDEEIFNKYMDLVIKHNAAFSIITY